MACVAQAVTGASKYATPAPAFRPANRLRFSKNSSVAEKPRLGNLQGLRVLCIDNEPDILAGMQALLSRWGCTVFTSGDGVSARQLLAEKDPHVVLADYHLSDNEDGLLLLRELSVGRAGALVTADHTDEVANQVRSAGLGLLRKPVKPAALRAFLSAQTR